ncbi:MAG: hypothetical protein A2X45_19080 [Lentisphaerae bacterium GWF2_50_93]|nr:MAG: hypothetical protein A2X45_19080 [Lentisphaerae bacterium GWF2_50_93]
MDAPAEKKAEPATGRKTLLTFDASYDVKTVKGNGGTAEAGSPGTLLIKTPAKAGWPGVIIPAPEGKWDLSDYEYICVNIHNVDTHDIDVFVRVDNPGADGHKNCITERTAMQPDQHVTLTVQLKRVSSSPIKLFGMNGYPQGLYPDKVGLDASNIVAITIFTASTPNDNKFEISNAYAAGKYEVPKWITMTDKEFFPFVDKYGQFIHKEWPGKIHSDEELLKNKDAEAKKLETDPGPANWDKWGGWAKGPELKATGSFRTEKIDGKWWLVDPDGHLFFSTGITCVGMGWAMTPVEDRAAWFKDLPPNEDANKEFYTKTWKSWSGHYKGREPLCFDFSKINLSRKYGSDWKKVYPDVIHKRLRSWGINTFGNWSDGRIAKMQRTPYTMTFFYDAKKLRNNGGGFPDVFDPKFQGAVDNAAKNWLKGTADDPWCIGYFLDNEMPWGGEVTLARETLASPADQGAKKEMILFLQKKYPEITELNKAWGTNFATWDAFAKETKADPKTDLAKKDLTEFTGLIAETYFRTVKEAIKKVAPDKLYLGCRCVGGSMNIITAAAKYCDVISYNRYCHSVRDMLLPEGVDAPTLIGEFHFGALDRGMFWNGLVSSDNQAERAKNYAGYVNSALDNPQIVGTHWFQYGDEAVTGRGDGENAQCGFVDGCDTPYEETIKAAREVGEKMYEHRAGKKQ